MTPEAEKHVNLVTIKAGISRQGPHQEGGHSPEGFRAGNLAREVNGMHSFSTVQYKFSTDHLAENFDSIA